MFNTHRTRWFVSFGLNVTVLFGCALNADSPSWFNSSKELLELERVRFPSPECYVTDSGLRVLIARRDYAPVVSLQLVIGSGSSSDPVGKESVASIAYEHIANQVLCCVEQPLPSRGKGLIQEAKVYVEPAWGRIEITLLPEDLNAVISNLGVALNRLISDSHTPWDSPLTGCVKGCVYSRSLDCIDAEHVNSFLRHHLHPENMAVVVAGRVLQLDPLALVERHFSGWLVSRSSLWPARDSAVVKERSGFSPSAEEQEARVSKIDLSPPKWLGNYEQENTVSLLVMDRPLGVKVRLELLLPPAKTAQEESSIRLAREAIGDSLRRKLREEANISYRINTALSLDSSGTALSFEASAEKEDLQKALDSFKRAIDESGEELAAKDIRLKNIRRAALRSLAEELDKVPDLGAGVARLYARGLPMDHYQQVADAIISGNVLPSSN